MAQRTQNWIDYIGRIQSLLIHQSIEWEKEHSIEIFHFKAIRDQKREEIDRLEHEIAELRAAQVQEITKRKSEFEKEMQQKREDDDAALEKIQRQADQVWRNDL